MLSHLTVMGRTISGLLVVYQLDLESRTFAWPVWPLQMNKRIVLSQKFVTEIKKMLPHRKLGTWFAFQRDMLSKLEFVHLGFRRPMGRHHFFVRIRFLYGNWLGGPYAVLKADRFTGLRFLNWRRIRCCVRRERCYILVWLWFPRT